MSIYADRTVNDVVSTHTATALNVPKHNKKFVKISGLASKVDEIIILKKNIGTITIIHYLI